METGRISSWQLFQVTLSLIIGLTLVRVDPTLTQLAGPDAWLSMLLAFVIDMAIAGALYALARRFPGRTLFEYPPLILGRPLGKVVAVVYTWLFIHVAAISIYIFAAGYKLVMPETPLLAFVILIVLVSTVGAYYGLETLARASELTGPLSVIISVLIVTVSAKDMDLGNLRPVLAHGVKGPVEAGLVTASWFGVCVVLAVLMAFHENPERALFAKGAGVLLGTVIVTTLVLSTIAALGPVQAAHERVPAWTLVRVISVGGFFERLQMLFISMLMTTGFVTLGLLHHASSLGVAQIMGLKEYRPLVWPMGLILAALATSLLESNVDLQPFLQEAFPPYALLIEGGLTLLLLVVSWIRGSRAPAPNSR